MTGPHVKSKNLAPYSPCSSAKVAGTLAVLPQISLVSKQQSVAPAQMLAVEFRFFFQFQKTPCMPHTFSVFMAEIKNLLPNSTKNVMSERFRATHKATNSL